MNVFENIGSDENSKIRFFRKSCLCEEINLIRNRLRKFSFDFFFFLFQFLKKYY